MAWLGVLLLALTGSLGWALFLAFCIILFGN